MTYCDNDVCTKLIDKKDYYEVARHLSRHDIPHIMIFCSRGCLRDYYDETTTK